MFSFVLSLILEIWWLCPVVLWKLVWDNKANGTRSEQYVTSTFTCCDTRSGQRQFPEAIWAQMTVHIGQIYMKFCVTCVT